MSVQSSVLYFPSIEIRDDAWLKSALLLWDRIYRIVPEGYTPNDSYDVRLAKSYDLVRDVKLNNKDKEKAYKRLHEFVASGKTVAAGLSHQNIRLINMDKMDTRLQAEIAKYAVQENGWFQVPNQFAKWYMFFLSDSVARHRNLSLGTDNRDAWVAAPYFQRENKFLSEDFIPSYPEDTVSKMAYCYMACQDLIPLGVREAHISDVIHFSEHRSLQREQLRNVLQAFKQKISFIENIEHAVLEIDDFKKEFYSAVQEYKKATDQFRRANSLNATLAVGVPITVTFLGGIPALLTTVDPLISRANNLAAVTFGALGGLACRDFSRRGKDSCWEAYLVDIDTKLARERASVRYDRLMNEFIND